MNTDNSVQTRCFCGGDGGFPLNGLFLLLGGQGSSSSSSGFVVQHVCCLLGKSELCRLRWCSGSLDVPPGVLQGHPAPAAGGARMCLNATSPLLKHRLHSVLALGALYWSWGRGGFFVCSLEVVCYLIYSSLFAWFLDIFSNFYKIKFYSLPRCCAGMSWWVSAPWRIWMRNGCKIFLQVSFVSTLKTKACTERQIPPTYL